MSGPGFNAVGSEPVAAITVTIVGTWFNADPAVITVGTVPAASQFSGVRVLVEGLYRENLISINGEVKVQGTYREVLRSAQETRVQVWGVYREVLIPGVSTAPPAEMNVSIIW